MFRQIELLAGNDHPTMLRLVGWSFRGPPNSGVEIVTELHKNGDLAWALERERKGTGRCLSATEKSKVVFGVVCGMAYLHSRGIFLRCNLEPSEILLNERWEPVIDGLDLSRYLDGDLHLGPHSVNALYLAPELHRDDVYDFSVDVFAFALTLYGIFGRPAPMGNGGLMRTCYLLVQWIIKGGRYVKLLEIPDYHWSVICRCWKDNRHERPYLNMDVSHPYLKGFHEHSSRS
jgi:serine/threonine protein kinase